VYKGTDGSTYEGAWVENSQCGYGTLRYALSGDVYEGEFEDDLRHGQGKWTFTAEGHVCVYEGGFEDDEMHGQGTLTDDEGVVTRGVWQAGAFVDSPADSTATIEEDKQLQDEEGGSGGDVTISYPNGDSYTGAVLAGATSEGGTAVRHGYGVLTSADGSVYRGNFENDQRSGQGVQESENGCHYEGNFKDDLL
jgi:hypothetical protein